jgi:DNA-binding transcriptional MerR regulator
MSDDSRKLYYSIGEVADIFHVNESLLRFWEKEFPTTIKPKKNAKGTRSYTREDMECIRMVYFMVKEKGMTLAGAKKRLKEEKKGMTAQFELAQRLKKIRVELLKLQEELGKGDDAEGGEPDLLLDVPQRMVFASASEEVPAVSDSDELS